MKTSKKPETDSLTDAQLWRAVADSARPLRHKRARPARKEPPGDATAKTAPPTQQPRAAADDGSRPARKPPPPPPLPTLHPGAAPGVDRATALRLRRGEMPIDATLDLHGMTQKEAHSALLGHITRAHTLGQRCLLVITGKGGKSGKDGRETGVLRANVPRWLNEAPVRAHVLAFAPARPRHGGDGALYVLLRRMRETAR
jgi:DNA-nicking Smr family endonuclease